MNANTSVRFVSTAAVSALFALAFPLSEWERPMRGVFKLEVNPTHPLLKAVMGPRWNLAYNMADGVAGYVVPDKPVRFVFTRRTASLSMDFTLRQVMWGEEPKDL